MSISFIDSGVLVAVARSVGESSEKALRFFRYKNIDHSTDKRYNYFNYD